MNNVREGGREGGREEGARVRIVATLGVHSRPAREKREREKETRAAVCCFLRATARAHSEQWTHYGGAVRLTEKYSHTNRRNSINDTQDGLGQRQRDSHQTKAIMKG